MPNNHKGPRAEPIPAFDDNYIWLLRKPGTRRVAVVDPGDADPVLERLDTEGLELEAVLVTHHHYDHVGGVEELARRFDAPVYGPAGETIPGRTVALREGDEVTLEGLDASLEVIDVPGHTRGHIAYLGHGMLFCGDTLFTGGCGRLFEGTPQQMYRSLEKLRRLPGPTLVYCAHEYTQANLGFARVVEPDNPDLLERIAQTDAARGRGLATVPSRLETERRTNPFLRSHVPGVIAAARGFARAPLETPAEVFATLRHWKDTLD